MKQTLGETLDKRMKEIGTNRKAVSRAAGLNETYLRDIIKGKSKNPTANRLDKIYAVLDAMAAGSIPKSLNEPSDQAIRFSAAIFGCWGTDYALAADRLEIDQPAIHRMERGDTPVPPEVLIRFHLKTGIPLWWFSDGRWDGVPTEIAGRMGHVVPDAWLPDVPGQ